MRHVDDAAQHGIAAGLLEVADVHAVELEHVEAQLAQAAHREMSCAEAVERKAHADSAEAIERQDRRARVGHDRRLGDLQAQRGRLEVAGAQRVRDRRREGGVAQLVGGDVHRHDEIRRRPRLAPAGELAAGLADGPFADRGHHARLLGGRHEVARTEQAAGRVLPVHARLERADATAAERELRLVAHVQLAAAQRVAQVDLVGEAGERAGAHLLAEDDVAVLAVLLGAVHRGVGVADELLGAAVVVGPADRRCRRRP